jgi:hypothetical protein
VAGNDQSLPHLEDLPDLSWHTALTIDPEPPVGRALTQRCGFPVADVYARCSKRISIEVEGRCFDKIFIKRFGRPLKYGCLCLHVWDSGFPAKAPVDRWFTI